MRLLAVLLLVSGVASANEVRVERRLLVKEGRLFAHLGGAWLARGDYYRGPTGFVSAQYYLSERGGFELRTGWVLSSLDASAQEVLERAGATPDAQQPTAIVLAGWRHTAGYGKAAVGASVVHFDLQLGAALGTVRTVKAWTPALAVSAGALVRLGEWLHAVVDVSLLASREERLRQRFVLGVLPGVAVGASW